MNPFNAGPISQRLAGTIVTEAILSGFTVSKQNVDANDLVAGELVYAAATATVAKAQADDATTQKVLGFAKAAFAVGVIGLVQISGVLTLSTAQWDVVTGTVGGLVPGAFYFLSASAAGKMTTTPPSVDGQYVVRVGWALSSTEFQIDMEPSVFL